MKKVQDDNIQKPVNIRPDMNNNNRRANLINLDDGLDNINSSYIGALPESAPVDNTKKEKNKKIVIGAAIGAGVLLAASLGLFIFNKVNADTTLPFKTINVEEYKNKEQVAEENNNDTLNIEIIDNSDLSNPAKINQYHKINTIVNTKLEGTKEYKDYESCYYVGLSRVESGYDEVIKYINEYNESGEKQVDIPSKEQFESQYVGMTLVMFETEIKYPSDYPTNLGENKVHRVPNLSLSLTGTYKDDTNTDYSNMIVVDKATFSINEAISITDKPKSLDITEENKFRYIMIMPIGAEESGYVININCDEHKFIYQGQSIIG